MNQNLKQMLKVVRMVAVLDTKRPLFILDKKIGCKSIF